MKCVALKGAVLSSVAVGGAILLASSCLALTSPEQTQNKLKISSLNLKVDETPINRDQPLKDSFAPIVEKVGPSVVKIFVTSSTPNRLLSGPDFDFFRRFFGENGLGPIIPGKPGSLLEHALGSGVIV